MKKGFICIILAFFLQGCLYINDRGISTELYNGCKEYYDAAGVYHKVCDKNLIEAKDLNPKSWFK